MPRHAPLVRQLKLLCRLEANPQGICVALEFPSGGAAYKRMRRDLEALEEAHIPLHREFRERREWVWLDENYRRHKLMPLSDVEVMALRWSARSAELPVVELRQALDGLIDKLDASLPASIAAFASQLDGIFVGDHFGQAHAVDPELVDTLGHACAERHCVDLVYRDSRGRETARRVDPYNLWSHRGSVYLITYCHLREAIRTFAVPRIVSAELRSETFEAPEGYSFDSFVEDRFRIMEEGQAEEVRVWFSPELSLYIRERTWHHSQGFEVADDGSVILDMTVDGLGEVASWVMSFGPRARALAPERLVTMIQAQLAAMSAGYETGRGAGRGAGGGAGGKKVARLARKG